MFNDNWVFLFIGNFRCCNTDAGQLRRHDRSAWREHDHYARCRSDRHDEHQRLHLDQLQGQAGRRPDDGRRALDGRAARRIGISAAFFVEQEFQQTGSFIYGLYKAGLGRQPSFAEFSIDRQRMPSGATLEEGKTALVESFVRRRGFLERYEASITADSFVDALLTTVRQSSGVDLTSERSRLIADYNSHGNLDESRSVVVSALSEHPAIQAAERNAAFVLTEYFGYLRRDPDPGGYHFWLDVLNNREPGNYRGMVCAFLTSAEYQNRFSSVVTRTNAECGK